jgi:hypothetical protein
MRTNLFELYKDEIIGNESVLDVGYGGLEDLVCFEDGPFKILHGIDRLPASTFQHYVISRNVIAQKKSLDYTQFKKLYRIEEVNIKDYDFGKNRHNFIICRNILHFFPDPEKFPLIERIYSALAPRGLMYLQLYHATSQKVIENYDYLGMNTYGKNGFSDKYYLVDHKLFVVEVKKKYHILNNECTIDENWIRFVIKK